MQILAVALPGYITELPSLSKFRKKKTWEKKELERNIVTAGRRKSQQYTNKTLTLTFKGDRRKHFICETKTRKKSYIQITKSSWKLKVMTAEMKIQ